jgi:membrane-bound serine protease (ClpP class)
MDWYLTLALALIIAGVIFQAAELLLPTGGIFIVLGALCCIGAVVVVIMFGKTWEAFAITLVVAVGGPLALWQFGTLAQKRAALLKVDPEETPPLLAGLEQYAGRFGRTVTPLRPGGSVEIDGRRLDAVSEGQMIDAGVPVKCVAVRFGTLVVRPSETPRELDQLPVDTLS